jgi:hypothetical protein
MMDSAHNSMVGEMSIMDGSGHKQLTWDTNRPDEIAAAQKAFNRLVAKGYSAFASEKKMEPKYRVSKFDPTMEEVIMVPRMVGG